MKVAVINLNWRKIKREGRFNKNTPTIPLELLYISDTLDSENIENNIIDLWALNKDIGDFKDIIKDVDYIILSTAPSYVFWRDGTIDAELPLKEIKRIRKFNENVKIILIGPHGTTSPSLFSNVDIDYIIRGEPEFVILDIIKNKLKSNGICYKKNGNWHINNKYAIVNNLNSLPSPGYNKLNLKLYKWPEEGTLIYESSRGCPFNCIFCFREGFRGNYREKSLKKIVEELENINKMRIKEIYFIDEIFGLNKRSLKIISKELKKHNIGWGYETRPELLDENIIKILSQSKCKKIELGLESADMTILKTIGKPGIKLDILKKYIEILTNNKIKIHLFLTIGSPNETKETIKNTLNYISELPTKNVDYTAGLMIPYPNTRLWNIGKNEGRDLKEWKNINIHEGLIGNKFKDTELKKEFLLFSLKLKKLKKNNLIFTPLEWIVSILPSYFFKGNILLKIARKGYYILK